jgi:gamma-D-glutamyl-L-lysine dipeptidyl-peptidase
MGTRSKKILSLKVFLTTAISVLVLTLSYFVFVGCREERAIVIASIADIRNARDKMSSSAYVKQDRNEVTQVLFGEELEITGEEVEGFVPVKVLGQSFFDKDENICALMSGWIEKDKILKVKKFPMYNLIIHSSRVDDFYMGTKLMGVKKDDKFWHIQLPDGRLIKISEESVFELDKSCLKSNNELRKIVSNSAKAFLGAPYLWGGRSILGPDCSGLVSICFSLCGIDIPRNAMTQYQVCKKLYDKIDVGDLAFLSDSAAPDDIGHVMIYVGGDNFIEARGMNVRKVILSSAVSRLGKKVSLLKSGDKVSENRFIFFGTYL